MRFAVLLVVVVVGATVSAASSANAAITVFRTPSGNIGCAAGTSDGSQFLRCDVARTRARAPRRPASCDLAWGNAFEMDGRSRPQRICHGDTVGFGGRVLVYGRSIRLGAFTCTSRRVGLTCRNRAGYGWFLSFERVASYRD